MDGDHADDADAQEQAQDLVGGQDGNGPSATVEQGQEVVNTPNADSILQAVLGNRPDVLKQLIETGHKYFLDMSDNVLNVQDHHGWTPLHHAAYLGYAECVAILLSCKTQVHMDPKDSTGSTPLMAACANIPISKECVKVLCEHGADVNAINNLRMSSLFMVLLRKPDLKVVEWLVGRGAELVNKEEVFDLDQVQLLPDGPIPLPVGVNAFIALFLGNGAKGVQHPAYDLDDDDDLEPLKTDETEVAEVAIYLAKQFRVDSSLSRLMFWNGRIQKRHVLEQVIDCFLEAGGEAGEDQFSPEDFEWWAISSDCSCSVMTVFAQKSLIYLEGAITSLVVDEVTFHDYYKDISMVCISNLIKALILLGMTAGYLPLIDVKRMHKILQYEIGADLPPNFRPLEIMYAMAKNPPKLSQLARTKIRTHLAQCGKFSRENIRSLDLPHTLIEYMQLADLGDGSKVTKIMDGTLEIFDDNDGDWSDEDEMNDDIEGGGDQMEV